MKIENALKRYGLGEREIAIYLCLLKYIELPVFDLSKQTGIPRTTVYAVVEGLKKKGFANSIKKNNVIYYNPENPTKFLQTLKEIEKEIEEVIPKMLQLTKESEHEPVTKLYIGLQGVKTVFEDILETLTAKREKIMYASSHPDLLELLPKFFPVWVKRRADLGIHTKLIVPESVKNDLPKLYESTNVLETRFLPGQFPFDAITAIYGEKTACISIKNGQCFSVIIDSPTITNSFKQFFLFSWEILGKQNEATKEDGQNKNTP